MKMIKNYLKEKLVNDIVQKVKKRISKLVPGL